MKTFLLAWCLTLATAASVSAQCTTPRYRKVQDTTSKAGGSMNLSIRPDDVTLEKLVCLAQTLQKQHELWKNWGVFIFTSDEAAKSFVPPNGSAPGDHLQDLRARANIGNGNLSLTIMPIGYATPYFAVTPLGSVGETIYNTRIDLPIRGSAHCRLEMNSRCLLALDPPSYPKEALKARASGKVVLTGAVGRDGKVTATIESAGGRQSAESDPLVRAALENLKSWWLEPLRRQDTFRITYSYVIDPALRPDQFDVTFDLPNQITIRASPQ
jgi:hypothetical protein